MASVDSTLHQDNQLGHSDQSCNECKRRKGKCDRRLPQCSQCVRSRRHCLYDRHDRTPLTRRYLTELEERLKNAEHRMKQAERKAAAAEDHLTLLRQSRNLHGGRAIHPVDGLCDWSQQLSCISTTATEIVPVSSEGSIRDDAESSPDVRTSAIPEGGPRQLDDLDWDENVTPSSQVDMSPGSSLWSTEEVFDGMASLSVEQKGAGYLGVASGAAMLRLLLPDIENLRRANRTCPSIDDNLRPNSRTSTPFRDALRVLEIDLDAAIDSYFSLYHLNYPLVHEPTFRAQYTFVIPRPNGPSFDALTYIIGAIGMFTTATDSSNDDDLKLMEAAKFHITPGVLEKGNITLVQALALMSNYLQKRNKPNSGYNYLGLALHMAMGLGLHKGCETWKISPLNMECRRRIWWTLHNFYIGALISFGRPWSWPEHGIEISMPLNIRDQDLTNASTSMPPAREFVTTYSLLVMQAMFHRATSHIYVKITSAEFPAASELLRLDDQHLGAWVSTVPVWYAEMAAVPPKFALGHRIMWWRLRNFRIIMYRPFVIRSASRAARGGGLQTHSASEQDAIDRCLEEAKTTILSIREGWSSVTHNRLAAWYTLYFLFQACLIPCVCLRNLPTSSKATDWQNQVKVTMSVMNEIVPLNPSSKDCLAVLTRLCGHCLEPAQGKPCSPVEWPAETQAAEEEAQPQISNACSMMWPSADPASIDTFMRESAWSDVLCGLSSLPDINNARFG